MIRTALIAAVLSGCFYTDPINQRPSLEIHQAHPGAPVYRNNPVSLSAISSDPDGDAVALVWRAYACSFTAPDTTACDDEPFTTGADATFTFIAPGTTAGGGAFNVLHVTLEGRDNFGAVAKPSQSLDLFVGDRDPTLELRADPRHSYVVNTPIGIYARVGDADDGPAGVLPLEWHAFAPATTIPNDTVFTPHAAPADDASHLQFAQTFTPNGTGSWDLQVIARDPQDSPLTPHVVEQHLMIDVDADHAPCLAQWAPAATTVPGTTIPLTAPTLFQVLVVADDLDPYPAVPNDPILGTTAFHWSIVPPGGSRQPLSGVTGNGVPLDPASYTPGDLVELRVEIEDRNHTHVNCPDGDLTCSVISDPSCLQRLTWRAEIR